MLYFLSNNIFKLKYSIILVLNTLIKLSIITFVIRNAPE